MNMFHIKNKIATLTLNYECNVDIVAYNDHIIINDEKLNVNVELCRIVLTGKGKIITYKDYRKKYVYLNIINLTTEHLNLSAMTILDIKKSKINLLSSDKIGSLFLKRAIINHVQVTGMIKSMYIENDNTICTLKSLGTDCITVKGQRNLIGTFEGEMDCYYNEESLLIMEKK